MRCLYPFCTALQKIMLNRFNIMQGGGSFLVSVRAGVCSSGGSVSVSALGLGVAAVRSCRGVAHALPVCACFHLSVMPSTKRYKPHPEKITTGAGERLTCSPSCFRLGVRCCCLLGSRSPRGSCAAPSLSPRSSQCRVSALATPCRLTCSNACVKRALNVR